MKDKLWMKIQFLRILTIMEHGVGSEENSALSSSLIYANFIPTYVYFIYDLDSANSLAVHALEIHAQDPNPGK